VSSFYLEVSQVSFSVKEKNPTILDGQLHYYSCIWFELIVFQVSKTIFNSESQSVFIIFLSSFEGKIVSTLTWNDSDLYLAFFWSFTHYESENKYMHVHFHLDCLLILI